jgi:predicted nuclease of restriction endonuclease-like (RecB) superfamily
MKKKSKSLNPTPSLASDYVVLLSEVKQRIRAAQLRTAMAANAGALMLYWEIGIVLTSQLKTEGWGARVLARLANDLKNELPEEKGFSERNLKRMVQFATEYPFLFAIGPLAVAQLPAGGKLADSRANSVLSEALKPNSTPHHPIGPRPVAQLPAETTDAAIWQRAVAQLPWAHNIILIQKVKDLPTRLWYAQAAFENGWSRDVLSLQIDSHAHKRQGKAVTNFERTLPSPQSDLAAQLLKDPYIFDFLTLEKPFQERELETGLLRHLQDFLVELGTGFAFVGRQVHMEVGDDDFYIDLLFYHLHLRCFIVIDLKVGKFKAEYAGKIHPVRYISYVLLRLCPQESFRRSVLHRLHKRPSAAYPTTRSRRSSVDCEAFTSRIGLLRSMSLSKRCHSPRKVSEIRMGKEIHQVSTSGLSHGVNFYLNAVDDRMKHESDQPSIGLILCEDKNKIVAEYALRGMEKSIGVSAYELTRALPKKLQSALPSIEQLEAELSPARSSKPAATAKKKPTKSPRRRKPE